MKLKLLVMTAFCILLSSCALTTSYDFDKTVDFSNYKSFTIYQQGIDKLKLNDIDKSRIIRALENQLKSKGLTESADGDLIVNVLASSKKVINVDNDPYWNGPWGWGYYWAPSSTVYETREGKLTFHLVDSKKNILVWEGMVDGFDVGNIKNKEEQINKAIQKIFNYYPPKKKNNSYY
ncbi:MULTISPECIES: DUF4136 domain-containing protein [Apibacter]|uniref:DUF4136 domain-containing protein n=1 Tax=Apibacter TaxID=1778601 RepID=UPI001C6A38AC|nr:MULTISPECIES: DUF4136 domain-containing protein [Apibacter]QYN49401.1 DUF4136 domain-containing protein [Apibacter sp. ESL0432]